MLGVEKDRIVLDVLRLEQETALSLLNKKHLTNWELDLIFLDNFDDLV
jgi:hypothetical protein